MCLLLDVLLSLEMTFNIINLMPRPLTSVTVANLDKLDCVPIENN